MVSELLVAVLGPYWAIRIATRGKVPSSTKIVVHYSLVSKFLDVALGPDGPSGTVNKVVG